MKKPPLAEQLRPQKLSEVVGQKHLVGNGGFLSELIKSKTALSIILWGPPGCGKTSIAKLYAKELSMDFQTMSPVFSGVAELKKIVQNIKKSPLFHQGTVLFVDEIHRFNRAQQDAFLPYVEDGTITLVGATAENPSYHLNDALLSRTRVLTLNSLEEEALEQLLKHYEETFSSLPLANEAKKNLLTLAKGDGRYLFNLIENLLSTPTETPLTAEEVEKRLQKRTAPYDRAQDHHYRLISALHKSIRGSDPDAALYWFSRMIIGGEAPLFIARRLIRMAAEDIGLADPHALTLAISAKNSYEMLGSPEGELSLAEVVVYLALAPKSNAIYQAYQQAHSLAEKSSLLPPPPSLVNPNTPLDKELGFGKEYKYDHEFPHAYAGQDFFPTEWKGDTPSLYQPTQRGFERELEKRRQFFADLKKNSTS